MTYKVRTFEKKTNKQTNKKTKIYINYNWLKQDAMLLSIYLILLSLFESHVCWGELCFFCNPKGTIFL